MFDEVLVTGEISIHTLAWRVTYMWRIRTEVKKNFNPHPRVEGDLLRRLWGILKS